eukprot:m.34357 g.34357  ORF g.34357 m.34357 type:complete len:161 (+) comp10705_c0_seq1:221-703(+)
MFVPLDHFNDAYDRIHTSALTDDCSVLILAAADTDAVCATSIIVNLLKADLISYKLVPVSSHDDFEAVKDGLAQNPGKIKSVILINAGATSDVLYEFEAQSGSANGDVSFYIIDSHRPVNLANIYHDEDRVFVFDDGQVGTCAPRPRAWCFVSRRLGTLG